MSFGLSEPDQKVVLPLYHGREPWPLSLLYALLAALALGVGMSAAFSVTTAGPAALILAAPFLAVGVHWMVTVLKGRRVIPCARVVIQGQRVHVTTPILGRGFNNEWYRLGEPIRLRQGPPRRPPVPGYTETFFVEQGEASSRYRALGRIEWESLLALKRELSMRRTALTTEVLMPDEWWDHEREWDSLDR